MGDETDDEDLQDRETNARLVVHLFGVVLLIFAGWCFTEAVKIYFDDPRAPPISRRVAAYDDPPASTTLRPVNPCKAEP